MLNASAARQNGFSLIELLLGIAVLAILLGLSVPSFQIWLQNTQIRTAAESVQNGLQLARGEAVKRNARVAFVLGADTSWDVVVVGGAVIQSRPAGEGSKKITRTVLPANATTLTYNSFGSRVANADGSPSITQIDLDSPSLLPALSKDLRITIGIGGNVRMCDPNAPISSASAC